jgi:hypothetical protein
MFKVYVLLACRVFLLIAGLVLALGLPAEAPHLHRMLVAGICLSVVIIPSFTKECRTAGVAKRVARTNTGCRFFSIDPFDMLARAYMALWPNLPCPLVWWVEPDLAQEEAGAVGYATYPSDRSKRAVIMFDSSLPVGDVVECLGEELARAACHHLGIEQDAEDYDEQQQACAEALTAKCSELIEAKRAARKKNKKMRKPGIGSIMCC